MFHKKISYALAFFKICHNFGPSNKNTDNANARTFLVVAQKFLPLELRNCTAIQ